jgi:hypothetical protein
MLMMMKSMLFFKFFNVFARNIDEKSAAVLMHLVHRASIAGCVIYYLIYSLLLYSACYLSIRNRFYIMVCIDILCTFF